MTMIADQLRQKARRINAPTPIDDEFCKSMMQSIMTLKGVTFVAWVITLGYEGENQGATRAAVSYTHLTLPTIE